MSKPRSTLLVLSSKEKGGRSGGRRVFRKNCARICTDGDLRTNPRTRHRIRGRFSRVVAPAVDGWMDSVWARRERGQALVPHYINPHFADSFNTLQRALCSHAFRGTRGRAHLDIYTNIFFLFRKGDCAPLSTSTATISIG